MAKLELFWDVGSPYTYLVVTQLAGLRRRTGAEVVLRPFLLGGVFKTVGNTLPAALRPKAAYIREDLRRWAHLYGVPIKLPPDEMPFPINTLLPMRMAVAAERDHGGEAFCSAIFDAYWGRGQDVSNAAVAVNVAHQLGMDGDSLLGSAQSQSVKDALRANTDEAVERGAFGAPAMFIGDELYWGNDRLALVEQRLRELGADR